MKTSARRLIMSLNCGVISYTDATLQDPISINPFEITKLPGHISRRMTLALNSWQGYLQAIRNGEGAYNRYDSSSYSGSVRIGLPNGQGILTQPDGSRHDGKWHNGLPHGQGICTWTDGSRCDGEWIDGSPEIFGKIPNLFKFKKTTLPSAGNLNARNAVILQSLNDHNSTFRIPEKHPELLAEALSVGKYNAKIIHFHSTNELETKIRSMAQTSYFVDLVWIRAHGSGDSIDESITPNALSQILNPLIDKRCYVVLESCETGTPGMFAEKLTRSLSHLGKDIITIAPNGNPAWRGLDLAALAKGKLVIPMVGVKKDKAIFITSIITFSRESKTISSESPTDF